MNTPTHLYRDRQGDIHPVLPEAPLPGRMWICRRTTDGTTLYLHESLLTAIAD